MFRIYVTPTPELSTPQIGAITGHFIVHGLSGRRSDICAVSYRGRCRDHEK